ncbi:hypothetical protein L1987_71720 [Smallanthus sonchifolius]|uniref:Uncharacterized protein n=1 Tax=Smallanthus sonchifolius TaxID=185202 RepID=A0ACB9ASM5_9ASTR|nr:hypothetical protein L1987_71720 [Smallanthus sonchifolius]
MRHRPSAYPVNEGVAWYLHGEKGFQNRDALCAIGVNQNQSTHDDILLLVRARESMAALLLRFADKEINDGSQHKGHSM